MVGLVLLSGSSVFLGALGGWYRSFDGVRGLGRKLHAGTRAGEESPNGVLGPVPIEMGVGRIGFGAKSGGGFEEPLGPARFGS